MIITAKPHDVQDIADFWFEILEANNNHLRFNKRALIEILDHAVSSAKHFCVFEKTGDMVSGCLVATVEKFPYAEKSYAQIQILEGLSKAALYNEFVAWFKPRKAIIAIGYSNIHKSRTPLFLKHKNFEFTGSMLIKYRY